MRNAVGFFVAAGQATDSSAVYAGAGRNLGRGSFLDGLLGNERIPPAHGQESMPVHVHSQLDEEVVNGEP